MKNYPSFMHAQADAHNKAFELVDGDSPLWIILAEAKQNGNPFSESEIEELQEMYRYFFSRQWRKIITEMILLGQAPECSMSRTFMLNRFPNL